MERTVGGGGKSDTRKEKLSSLRDAQGKQMTQTVRDLCAQILPEAGPEADDDGDDGEEGVGATRVTRADVDDRVLDFLCTVPTSIAEEALREAKALDMDDVSAAGPNPILPPMPESAHVCRGSRRSPRLACVVTGAQPVSLPDGRVEEARRRE